MATRNFLILVNLNISNLLQLGTKENTSLESFMFLVQGQLYHLGQDQVLRCCFEDLEIPMVLQEVHEQVSGGHLSSETTICKILDAKYWSPMMQKDVMKYC